MKKVVLVAVAIALCAFATGANAWGDKKKETEEIIKNYLMENPAVIVDALEKYQQEQMSKQSKAEEKVVQESQAWLFDNGAHPTSGAKDGTKVAEFLDYNCGYCKHAFPDVKQLLSEDKNLTVVFVDLPILGPSSLDAAKWALASAKQNKYFEYHTALMEHKGQKDESALTSLAERVGLNVEQLKKDKDLPEISKQLDENLAKAQAMGISGTPAFVTKAEIVRGYVGLDGMKASIQKARDAK